MLLVKHPTMHASLLVQVPLVGEQPEVAEALRAGRGLRAPNLPTVRRSLLRFVDSKFPGKSSMDMRIPTPKIEILLVYRHFQGRANPHKHKQCVNLFGGQV